MRCSMLEDVGEGPLCFIEIHIGLSGCLTVSHCHTVRRRCCWMPGMTVLIRLINVLLAPGQRLATSSKILSRVGTPDNCLLD